ERVASGRYAGKVDLGDHAGDRAEGGGWEVVETGVVEKTEEDGLVDDEVEVHKAVADVFTEPIAVLTIGDAADGAHGVRGDLEEGEHAVATGAGGAAIDGAGAGRGGGGGVVGGGEAIARIEEVVTQVGVGVGAGGGGELAAFLIAIRGGEGRRDGG